MEVQVEEKSPNIKTAVYMSVWMILILVLLVLIFTTIFSYGFSEAIIRFAILYFIIALININTFRISTKRKDISFELPNQEAYEHFLAYLKRRYDLKEENSDQSSFLFQFRNPFYRLFSNWAHHKEVHMQVEGKSVFVNAAKLEADYIESFLLYNEDMKKLTA
jgi:hypothetical protein